MAEIINQIFSYPFMVRALVVGVLVSLCSALLGVNLVLKRYSMIGDGLSHVGFGAMAIAAALNFAPLIFAIPFVLIAAILLLGVKENSRIKGDAAIAIITSGSLAIGILASSLSGGMNTELMNYMFGSILSLSNLDTVLSVALSLLIIVFYLFFYNGIFSITFDEQFASATGVKTNTYRILIASLCAITVVLGMKMMGTLLISALLIFPPISAMRMAKTFKGVVVLSALISVACFVSGLVCSFVLGTPTGATVVAANIIFFLIACVLKKIIKV